MRITTKNTKIYSKICIITPYKFKTFSFNTNFSTLFFKNKMLKLINSNNIVGNMKSITIKKKDYSIRKWIFNK